jgi:hypothetical protein
VRRFLLTVLLAALLGGICGILPARPAQAHEGPPFAILVDRRAGPYVVDVWGDPDIGTATFFVLLETAPPAGTAVRLGVRPVSGRLPEVTYPAEAQAVRQGARYFTQAALDRGEMWRFRVLLDGPAGRGELAGEVLATPAGSLGPIDLLIYSFPFLAVGFLWLKAVLRRRAPKTPTTPETPKQGAA